MKQHLNEVKKLQKLAGILKEDFNNPGEQLMGLDLVKSELGNQTDANELASFLYHNYEKVTGQDESDRDLERSFPQVFDDIFDYYKINSMEFQDAWTTIGG
jgi:hypothetical protein